MPRSRRRATTATLALALVGQASAQFASDAPSCASLCIRVKISEAADPGLAVGCDVNQPSTYVSCLCASSKFTKAYDVCLTQNCYYYSDLQTGRDLFSSFCNNAPVAEQSAAISVGSVAVASQASTKTGVSSSAASATTSAAAKTTSISTTSGGTSSPASTSATSVSPASASTSGSASATTSTTGGSSSTSRNTVSFTTGSQSTTQSSSTGSASQTTSGNASQTGESGSGLNAAAIASARANATGVNAAGRHISPVPFAAIAATVASLTVGFYSLLRV